MEASFFFEKFGDVFARLRGGGGKAGHLDAIFIDKIDDISCCEEVGVAGEREVGFDGDASTAIRFYSDLSGEVVRLHSRCPDDGFGFNPAVFGDERAGRCFVEVDATGLNVIDARAEKDVDTEVLQSAFGVFRELRFEGFEKPIA